MESDKERLWSSMLLVGRLLRSFFMELKQSLFRLITAAELVGDAWLSSSGSWNCGGGLITSGAIRKEFTLSSHSVEKVETFGPHQPWAEQTKVVFSIFDFNSALSHESVAEVSPQA